MNILLIAGLLLLGAIAGYLSGLVGIGGGVVIVPALVLLFGFSEHLAQGTTLALLIPPIGILAVMTYFKEGYVDIKTAAIICIGFVIGGYFGGKMAIGIPDILLKRIFGAVIIALGLKMILFSKL